MLLLKCYIKIVAIVIAKSRQEEKTMKKIHALFLSALMLISCIISAVPVSAEGNEIIPGEFTADRYDVCRNKGEYLTFTLKVTSDRRLPDGSVKVCDDEGRTEAYMYDDGTHGDKLAYDGIYTAMFMPQHKDVCTVMYHAQAGNVRSANFPVKFHDTITDEDFDTAHKLWKKLDAIENTLAERGAAPEEIADTAYDWLIQNEYDKLASVKRENPRAFSFTLKTGIENYFEHFEHEKEAENALQIEEKVRSMSYIGANSIGVWSPYYGYDSSFSYNYLERAKAMQEVAGYDTVESYYGANASVESFKNFDRYGVIMIDSHGADYQGGGYICIPKPGEYDKEDVKEGHIVLSGDTVFLRGTFMEKYCDTLPNSIIYIGICYGMGADNLYAPLINHGAAFVCGYTRSVSFTFDAIQMDEFCMQLVKENPETGMQNTAGEAFDTAIALHGAVDPYGGENAVFIAKGDPDAVALGLKIPVESVTFDPDRITLYRNNTMKMSPVISPSDANSYKLSWESSDENTVSIDEKGNIFAKASGEADITLTLTDLAEDSEKVYTAVCRITVDGDMPVSGITAQPVMNLYSDTGMTGTISAHVLPENATNQNIIYKSTDESIAKVDESGQVTPVAAGTAQIIAVSEEGGFCSYVTVYVSVADIDAALNKTNGCLTFTAGDAHELYADGERLAARTANHSHSSKSSFTLKAALKKGDRIVFDWSASSEAGYDQFTFYVNGEDVDAISGDTGWTNVEYTIPKDDNYIFVWRYTKDYSESYGDDCGMLDEVDIIGENDVHVVTFYDMDRETVIEEQTIEHGSYAQAPSAPYHDGYRFLYWDGDYTNVRADASVYAVYEEYEVVMHTVTFLDMDGSVIAEVQTQDGKSAQAPQAPEHEGYIFTGWDSDISCVTEDMTVNAVYERVKFKVTFTDIDDTVLAEGEVEYDGSAELIAPPAPEHEGMRFDGWDKPLYNIREDTIFKAQYVPAEYVVTFLDMDGEEIASVLVMHGNDANAPEPPKHDGYVFAGWDKDLQNVTENMTVTALYIQTGDCNGDGTVNTADAVVVLKYAAEMIQLDSIQLSCADINGDGTVNTADATYILKLAAGMITR